MLLFSTTAQLLSEQVFPPIDLSQLIQPVDGSITDHLDGISLVLSIACWLLRLVLIANKPDAVRKTKR